MWRSLEVSEVYAIALSKDHKWIVSGSMEGATVWDTKSHDKVHQVDSSNVVGTVDISPDSTKFATGSWLAGTSLDSENSVNVCVRNSIFTSPNHNHTLTY